CSAWSFVRPGRCYLKDRVPNPVPNTCCISGIRYRRLGKPQPPQPSFVILPGMEDNTNRPGSDYHTFDGAPQPASCRTICAKHSDQCRAWSWVKPPPGQTFGRCYFKSTVPAPQPDPCCVSEVLQQSVSPDGATGGSAPSTGAPSDPGTP